jgi:hypothetical protein
MRPALPNQRQFPVRRRGKKRRLLSMRPEKRPQTIMEQYRYREMMREKHNRQIALNQMCSRLAESFVPKHLQPHLTTVTYRVSP